MAFPEDYAVRQSCRLNWALAAGADWRRRVFLIDLQPEERNVGN
jgi:hypothetical protein